MNRNIWDKLIQSKSITNLFWLFSDKVLRLVLGVFVGVLITKHLGPTKFGMWNYVISIIALLNSLVNLGVDSILLNQLVSNHPSSIKKIFSAALWLRLITGFSGYIVILGFTFIWSSGNESNNLILYFIVGSNLIWQSSEIIDIYFQFGQRIRQATIVKYVSFFISLILKFIGVYFNFDLLYFVIVTSVELFIYFIIILSRYFISFGALSYNVEFNVFKKLVSNGFPLMLSSFLIIFYMRIDQIMLGYLKGDFEVGIYTSALKLSEIWYLIPTVLISSFSTEILILKRNSNFEFEKRLMLIMSSLIYVSFAISLFVTFISEDLIMFVYGIDFIGSGSVLTIHIWTGILVSIGVCSNLFSVSNNLNYLILYKSIIGAVTNILLNFVFIPKYGAVGASWATALSQFVVTLPADLFWKSSHELFRFKLRSLLLPLQLIQVKLNARNL